MKIKIFEREDVKETSVEIHCRSVNDEIVRLKTVLESFGLKIQGFKDKSRHMISIFDILYIECVDKKVFLYTHADIYDSTLKLYELQELLEEHDFIRIGKSMIINFSEVISIKPDFGGRLILIMSNQEQCCVSRQYAAEIKERLGA